MNNEGTILIPLQISGGWFCLLTQTYSRWIEKKVYIRHDCYQNRQNKHK